MRTLNGTILSTNPGVRHSSNWIMYAQLLKRTLLRQATAFARATRDEVSSFALQIHRPSLLRWAHRRAAEAVVRIYATPSQQDYLRFVGFGTMVTDMNGEAIVFASSSVVGSVLASSRVETLMVGPLEQTFLKNRTNPVAVAFPILKLDAGLSLLYTPSLSQLFSESAWSHLRSFSMRVSRAGAGSLPVLIDAATPPTSTWIPTMDSSGTLLPVSLQYQDQLAQMTATNNGSQKQDFSGLPLIGISPNVLVGIMGDWRPAEGAHRASFAPARAIRQACIAASSLTYDFRFGFNKKEASWMQLYECLRKQYYQLGSVDSAEQHLVRYGACINAANSAIRRHTMQSYARLAAADDLFDTPFHSVRPSGKYRHTVHEMHNSMVGRLANVRNATPARPVAAHTYKNFIADYDPAEGNFSDVEEYPENAYEVSEIVKLVSGNKALQKRVKARRVGGTMLLSIREASKTQAALPALLRSLIQSGMPLFALTHGSVTIKQRVLFQHECDLILAINDELVEENNACSLMLSFFERQRRYLNVLCWNYQRHQFVSRKLTGTTVYSFMYNVYADLLRFVPNLQPSLPLSASPEEIVNRMMAGEPIQQILSENTTRSRHPAGSAPKQARAD